MLLDAVQMKDYSSEGSIVGIGKFVDDGVNSIATCGRVLDASGVYEVVVRAARQERVGKLAEELFEKTSYTVDVVIERCRIAEVNDLRVCNRLDDVQSVNKNMHTVVKESLYLLDMAGSTTETVNALNIKTEEIDSLHALIDNHRNSRLISVVEFIEADTKDRFERRRQSSCDGTRRYSARLRGEALLGSHATWSCR